MSGWFLRPGPVAIHRSYDMARAQWLVTVIAVRSVMKRKDCGLRLSLAAIIIAGAVPGAAQDYPVKPIRIISQFAPGSSTDTTARIIAQKMTEHWGQQAIVDDRPGAGGVIGTDVGAKAPPDGYTLTMAPSSAFACAPSLYERPPYDPLRDFEPIANLVSQPQTLVASPNAEFKTLKEFVAAAKAKPGQINFASLGPGSTNHLSMEMFRAAAGIQLNHVPFRTSADMYVQLLSGQVKVMSDALPAAMPNVKAGKLYGLALAALKRSPFLPDMPTIAESGYPGYEALGWVGIAAPAKTPSAILDKLNAEMVRILNQPDVRERLNSLAFTPIGDSRAQFAAYIKSEIAKWGKVVKDSGAKAD
jgi:tripartite-type tricarboxylate transporter receptor subunit TctC